MTVEAIASSNAMNMQDVNNHTVHRMPKGGAELEYDGQYDAINAEQGMPTVNGSKLAVPAYSWREEEDTTDAENGVFSSSCTGCDEESCGEEPNSGFVPVSAAKNLPSSVSAEQTLPQNASSASDCVTPAEELKPFSFEETILIFDWDDTILPSAWVQGQGLRLDEESRVSEYQAEQLLQIAELAIETLRAAKQHGTVVMVTNAERGWIELSCQKFMPTLCPMLENIKLLSARTTYESRQCAAPLDWKICAFRSELSRMYGDAALADCSRRKNVLSLGDSMHEREALLRSTANLPNCRSKSLKFVERPDIAQICKQHSLITGCFERIIHHDGNLDLCIRFA
jgi:hypothetical protein